MKIRDISHMFHQFTYPKTTAQIKDKLTIKTTALKTKIEERAKRITAIRKEYDIDDAALIQLLEEARHQDKHMKTNYTYNSSLSNQVVGSGKGKQMEERNIAAGVVNNLLTEKDNMKSEQEQVKTLELMWRNLNAVARFSSTGTELSESPFFLSEDELEYLGF